VEESTPAAQDGREADQGGTAPVGTPATAAGMILITAILGMSAYVGGTQQGKYMATSLFFPLYTKLKRKKILDNFTRGRIYEYIRSHPGSHFNEIKRELDLKNGSLTYHLMTLEREEFVKSRNSGVYKRFYLYNVRVPKRQVIKLSRIQESIVAVLLVQPGATQKAIVDITGIKQQTVNRNINQLLEYGAVRVHRSGRKTLCYLNLDSEHRADGGSGEVNRPAVQLILKNCPHCGKKNSPLFHGCFPVPEMPGMDESATSPT